MKLIETINEMFANMDTLDKYIESKRDPEYSWAIQHVKKGICFVERNGKFYPSRFIGYVDNSMDAHDNNMHKDGRETNPRITKILGKKLCPDHDMESSYQSYCESLGFTPAEKGAFGVERKYWV